MSAKIPSEQPTIRSLSGQHVAESDTILVDAGINVFDEFKPEIERWLPLAHRTSSEKSLIVLLHAIWPGFFNTKPILWSTPVRFASAAMLTETAWFKLWTP